VSGARWASLALCIAGLVAGTLEPRAPAREPLRSGTDWLLAVDFHVHGFPGDGALPPWVLRDQAARAGLDAFVLTNHNRVSTARAARRMFGDTPGPLVIVGQEVTGRGFHIAAAGLEERVDWTSGAAAAIRAIHAEHGVAIAAHPSAAYRGGWDDAAIALLDGVERAHPSMQTPPADRQFTEFDAHAAALKPGIAFIGSSDYHVALAPGYCRTWVLARERSAAAIVAAVREGRTAAMDMGGRLYGNADIVRLVHDARVTAPKPRTPTAWSRVAAAGAAIGLLLLIVL
jgi:predicted metal-dependent phosphoesterase TrpH